MHLGKPLDQQYVYILNTNDIPYETVYCRGKGHWSRYRLKT